MKFPSTPQLFRLNVSIGKLTLVVHMIL